MTMRITITVPDELGAAIKAQTDNVSAYVTEALTEKLATEQRRAARERILGVVGGFEAPSDALDQLHEERRASDRT